MKTVIQVLKDARDLISTPDRWCTMTLQTPDLKQHCAVGAVLVAKNGCITWDSWYIEKEINALNSAIPASFVPSYKMPAKCSELDTMWSRVAQYNNATNHETVLAMFDLAIARQLVIDSMANATPAEMPENARTSAELVGV